MSASFWHSPKNINTYFYVSLAGFSRQQVDARTDRRFGSKAVVNGNYRRRDSVLDAQACQNMFDVFLTVLDSAPKISPVLPGNP
jgi:hypothetical protein